MFEDLNPLDKPTAIFEIVIMLVVAFLIGYFTRWFANRNKTERTKNNQSSEYELNTYKEKIKISNQEIENLKSELSEHKKTCNKLKEELIEHERIHFELKHKLTKPEPKFKSKEEAAEALGFKLAHENDKEDLTIIKGIGPFIQEKLNELGIYTIEQISDFTIDTVIKVTDAIEYFPGRIQRDFWVEQANQIISDRNK
ncbi:MAG: hypothetical protein JXR51_15450 [Bacteroidales bacterium]|nr:hypothetical protein [Bacteroidales bacterium]MBN2758566.1 hypothetical protein [Bacteroidales bacterium]